ncbi:unnamed protein product (macronuclear) [Paramecium tetraurelia]|uniref:UBZ4-type domain-containing protein n=1 Tax=Paramecium tetraurelia TaxID=5888 RepID=A0D5Y6_PARTE|nr:uncharacterized protein GSPATT00013883001 [Paramecium tetraurelia]CAK78453.1 unnamed protein product [Paramecium tetraurelia]|eukprot:XP_001445850.1 hypothetical protein (macronuclear) [Paramecium tetraurelia strain d4-2]
MSHNFDDGSVNNLLKEIDDLINRMGDQNESHKSDNSFKDQLRQTGRFVLENEQPCDVPKKFSTSIPKKQNNSQQKRVTIVAEKKSSSSSSSSSDEEYQVNKKKFKKDKQKQQSKYSPCKAKQAGSQCSYRSKAKSNLKCETQSQLSQVKTQQNQLLVQPVKDVFCLICEEFIPIDIVNIHMADCQQITNSGNENQMLKLKLENYKKLLSLRFEAAFDENVKQLIELLYNCTQQILDVSDQYQLSQTIEDLCILKTQLNQNTKAYHVLTVAQKIQEIANRKMQVLISEQEKHSEIREPSTISYQNKINIQKQEQLVDRQTIISYATNTTSRKRLFESPSFQHMPKQLVKMSSINAKPISQVQNQNKSPVKQEQMNQKTGIEFGNNYDSSKKRSYIQLSNSKNLSQVHTIQNHQENNRESEPTVISKIQSYISNVKGKFSNENEQIKKKFFLQACKCKDKFPVNHPAQNVLISEMFNQSQRQQIPENEWEVWIYNVLQNA